MAEDTRKVARGLGIAAILGGALLLATKAKAAPPAPPEEPEPGLANLYGVVTDTTTGKAVPGVLITMNGIETCTFDDGSYSLVDLEPRGYDIVFSKEGYELFDLFNVAIIEGNNELNVEMTPIVPPEEEVTPPATVLAGVILDVKWREAGTEEWRSLPVSLPAYTGFDCKWRVRNNSNGLATFTTGIVSMNYYRAYGQTVMTLEPGEEADLIFIGFDGFSAGTSGSEVIYLGVLPGTITKTGQQYWIEAELVDSVILHYNWY